MLLKRLNWSVTKVVGKLPLQTVLIVPFIVQISATVGLVAYFSFKNGQQAVNDLANQLMNQVSDRTGQHLESYTDLPQKVAQVVADDLELGKINLDSQNLQGLDTYFLKRIKTFNSVSFIYTGNEQGKFIGAGPVRRDGTLSYIIEVTDGTTNGSYVSYATDNQANRTKKLNVVPNYDPRRRPWYKAAVQKGKPTWSEIYAFIGEANKGLTITAVNPFSTQSGKLSGVTAVDLYLNDINMFLQRLSISRSGKIFILEPNGLLVASSSNQQNYTVVNGQLQRIPVSASKDPLMRATVRYLTKQFGSFDQIKNTQQLQIKENNQRHFVRITPWKDDIGLNWFIVAVVPEADFMGQINANNHRTILLCILALIGSIVISIKTASWVTKPILRLNTAAKKVAKGEWDKTVEIDRRDEVGELAKSFNQMAKELQVSFTEMEGLNEALEKSEQRINQLLESLPVGVAVINRDGISYTNQVGKQLLGTDVIFDTRQENRSAIYQVYLAGTDQLYPGDRLPCVRSLQGETVMVDDMEIRRDGIAIALEMRTVPVFDSQGNVAYAITAFHDISDRKQAQKALQESEQRYAALAKAAPVGIFRHDAQGNCLYGNERSFEMIGVSQEEAFGAGWAKNLHPSDRDRVIAAWYNLVQRDIPFKCEYRFARPDGSVLWVFGQAIAQKDADGNVISYIGTITDITERKQVEAALQESEAKFRRLAENLPGVIYRYVLHPDKTHEFTYASPGTEELYEQKPEAVVQDARLVFDIVHPDDIAPLLESITVSAQTLQPWLMEYRIITPSGRLKLVQGSSRPERQPNGDIVWDGLLIDITSRKQAEQLLADYNLTLELQVAERTAQLAQANAQLQQEIAERKQIELSLQNSKQKLSAIIENVGASIYIKDLNSNYIYANRLCVELFGISEAEIIGTNDFKLYSKEMAKSITQNDKQVIESGVVLRFDEVGVVNNEERHFLAVKVPLKRHDGSVYAICGISTDITELKQTEAALRQSEARYRAILEQQTELIVRILPDGTVSFVNEAFCRFFGRRQEELINNHYEPVVFEEDREYVAQMMNCVSKENPVVTNENRVIARGEVRWTQWINRAIFDDFGRIVEYQAVGRDINDRKQVEEALSESEKRFRAIFDQAFQFVGLLQPDGILLEANQTALDFAGAIRSDVVGKPFWEARWWTISPETQAQLKVAIAQAANGKFIRYEVDVLGREDRVLAIDFSLRPILDEAGQVTLLISEGRDISDRKRVQQELQLAHDAAEAASRAKSSFLANMSHELRTPLNAILGFSQLLNRSTNLSTEQQENLGIIRRSGEHLLTLINQVLDLSKIEAGRMALNENNFDLYRLLGDVEDMFSLKAKDKGLQLIFELASDVPQHIRTDEVKLRQVLINLLSNAVKFTAHGSVSLRVTLEAENSSDFSILNSQNSKFKTQNSFSQSLIAFEISDTGVGIAADEFHNLFQPFVQTVSGQQVQEGTGLGLSISYQFIRLMGGEMTVISRGKAFTPSLADWELNISISNKNPALSHASTIQQFPHKSQENKTTRPIQGTTFKFDISAGIVAPNEVENQRQSRRVIALAPNQPRYRILVVDDSDYNRQLLIKLLSFLSFELQTANNGSEALKIWESWQPHLILMDMRMPVMDGYEATQRIQARQKRLGTREGRFPNSQFPISNHRTVIIALTASALEFEKAAVLEAGCDDFIRKPFQEEDIFEALHKHLDVSFIYEESTAVSNTISAKPLALSAADIAVLPKDLLARLRQAIIEGDLEQITALLEQVHLQNEVLANALLSLANQYQFDQLLTLLQPIVKT
ncbi:PAS domain S-box protein [Funiculus sociatus GB2-A5]|uniref:histidine kinase n=1 Tax=Funiculus sociatus GB2-A5 TaxID=2933946 RepID=A0ABV0JLZ3_9CYAN|nr:MULTISPECIES: PAS domain S-box protein [unclassified Trichocoleus]MBD1907072.1 PAS domain S-box protein [Trichocoleus sp. FACHB-832]MBD2063523.1 PAS domain S-box protein [Trichocoleus sp. FACHB-6]